MFIYPLGCYSAARKLQGLVSIMTKRMGRSALAAQRSDEATSTMCRRASRFHSTSFARYSSCQGRLCISQNSEATVAVREHTLETQHQLRRHAL
nr:hypothetical protein CFP56_28603 [Quercus suber]